MRLGKASPGAAAGTRHLISHLPIERALLSLSLSSREEDEAHSILETWEKATSVLENSTKREGLLLGNLRKHPEKAPPDMVVTR